jgi:hypothetical protein
VRDELQLEEKEEKKKKGGGAFFINKHTPKVNDTFLFMGESRPPASALGVSSLK